MPESPLGIDREIEGNQNGWIGEIETLWSIEGPIGVRWRLFQSWYEVVNHLQSQHEQGEEGV